MVVAGIRALWFMVAVGSGVATGVAGAGVVAYTTGVAGTVVAGVVVFIVPVLVHPAITIAPVHITRSMKMIRFCMSP
jgi:hypothetical protein